MNPWPFVLAAYALTLGATLVTTALALRGARAAERRAADSRGERD